jgi:hypothetical protein
VAVLAVGGWRLGVFLIGPRWLRWLSWATTHPMWVLWIGIGVAVLGGLISLGLSWQLKLHRRDLSADKWILLPLSDAAGVAAGWSVVYGASYLALSTTVLFLRPSLLTEGELWIRITVGGVTVAGLLLILIVPWLLVGHGAWTIHTRELNRASLIGLPSTTGTNQELRNAYVDDLAARGAACRWHARRTHRKTAIKLTWRGRWLFSRVRRASDARSR